MIHSISITTPTEKLRLIVCFPKCRPWLRCVTNTQLVNRLSTHVTI
ncbi:Uncharacterised protein [Vibrio cholerae]|nr:Uncharacterised protein [Vibrio cholerae]